MNRGLPRPLAFLTAGGLVAGHAVGGALRRAGGASRGDVVTGWSIVVLAGAPLAMSPGETVGWFPEPCVTVPRSTGSAGRRIP